MTFGYVSKMYIPFQGGDINGDGIIYIEDVVYFVNYLHQDGPPPDPLSAGDVHFDSLINLGGLPYLKSYLLKKGLPLSC